MRVEVKIYSMITKIMSAKQLEVAKRITRLSTKEVVEEQVLLPY